MLAEKPEEVMEIVNGAAAGAASRANSRAEESSASKLTESKSTLTELLEILLSQQSKILLSQPM